MSNPWASGDMTLYLGAPMVAKSPNVVFACPVPLASTCHNTAQAYRPERMHRISDKSLCTDATEHNAYTSSRNCRTASWQAPMDCTTSPCHISRNEEVDHGHACGYVLDASQAPGSLADYLCRHHCGDAQARRVARSAQERIPSRHSVPVCPSLCPMSWSKVRHSHLQPSCRHERADSLRLFGLACSCLTSWHSVTQYLGIVKWTL